LGINLHSIRLGAGVAMPAVPPCRGDLQRPRSGLVQTARKGVEIEKSKTKITINARKKKEVELGYREYPSNPRAKKRRRGGVGSRKIT